DPTWPLKSHCVHQIDLSERSFLLERTLDEPQVAGQYQSSIQTSASAMSHRAMSSEPLWGPSRPAAVGQSTDRPCHMSGARCGNAPRDWINDTWEELANPFQVTLGLCASVGLLIGACRLCCCGRAGIDTRRQIIDHSVTKKKEPRRHISPA